MVNCMDERGASSIKSINPRCVKPGTNVVSIAGDMKGTDLRASKLGGSVMG